MLLHKYIRARGDVWPTGDAPHELGPLRSVLAVSVAPVMSLSVMTKDRKMLLRSQPFRGHTQPWLVQLSHPSNGPTASDAPTVCSSFATVADKGDSSQSPLGEIQSVPSLPPNFPPR